MESTLLQEYTAFFEQLAANLSLSLGGEHEIHPVKNLKNNGVERNGMVIRTKGKNVAPTIYLDDFFQKHQSGYSLGAITSDILSILRESGSEYDSECLEHLSLTSDYIRKNVILSLINYDKNTEILSDCPHIRIQNLAICFRILAYRKLDTFGTIRLTNEHFHIFSEPFPNEEIAFQKLCQSAMKNQTQQFPLHFSTLKDSLNNLLAHSLPNSMDLFSSSEPLRDFPYLLSNSSGMNGAASILYPDVADELMRRFGKNYYIIPSSIHELLLLPADDGFLPGQINELISSVNENHVSDEEILSDTVYLASDLIDEISALYSRYFTP